MWRASYCVVQSVSSFSFLDAVRSEEKRSTHLSHFILYFSIWWFGKTVPEVPEARRECPYRLEWLSTWEAKAVLELQPLHGFGSMW